jgi:hypothetical protein
VVYGNTRQKDSNKNEHSSVGYNNMDESHKYKVEEKKPETKGSVYVYFKTSKTTYKCNKSRECLLMDMFISLIVLMVSQVYAYVQTH